MASKKKSLLIFSLAFLLSVVVVCLDWAGFSIIQFLGLSSSPRSGLVFLVAVWTCFGASVGGLLVDGPKHGSIAHSLLWSSVWLALMFLVLLTVISYSIYLMDGG